MIKEQEHSLECVCAIFIKGMVSKVNNQECRRRWKNVETKIETVCQHECLGRPIVVHATMDKDEISAKLLNVFNKNELGITLFFSFK